MVVFLVNWLLFLLFGALLANGIFLITRGHYEYKADGTVEKQGALLKAWWFFWFAERTKKKNVWYKGDHMQAVFDQLRSMIPSNIPMELNRDFITDRGSDHFTDFIANSTFGTSIEFIPYIPKMRNALDVKFKIDSIIKGVVTILVYKDEPEYIHSWYLRTMMAGCITCFSSFYGVVSFVLVNALFSPEALRPLYGPFGNTSPFIYLPVTLIAYCISLSYVNTWLFNRNK